MSLLTIRVAAERLGVGYSTLKRWVHLGRVRTTRTDGGHHRVSEDEIDRLMARHQPDSPARALPPLLDESIVDLSARNRLHGFIEEVLVDGLLAQPNLRPTGVPTHKAFLYTAWRAVDRLRITPSVDVAGDRWSDVNPIPPFPYVRTGGYVLATVDATYALSKNLELAIGVKNLLDENFELAWGFPQAGRTYYVKTRMTF